MGRRGAWLRWTALLVILGCDDASIYANAGQGPDSKAAMSEDVRRMHERLLALSRGEGSISDLRIEFMDGGGMSSLRSFNVEAGKLVSKEWKSLGSPMIHREGSVKDSRVTELLQRLIAEEYWTFQGTRFIPDAPMFLFRFYHEDFKYVDFRCDAEEFRDSDARSSIRSLFLTFVSETQMKTVPAK